MKPNDIKIGVKLYQYSNKILEYIVTGIDTLEAGEHKEVFYILECQSCADHEKCKLMVKFNDYGVLTYSHMLNNYDYDEEYRQEHGHYRNEQYYWHINENQAFFKTRKEAQKWVIERNIKYIEEKIEECDKNRKTWMKDLEKAQSDLEVLNEA